MNKFTRMLCSFALMTLMGSVSLTAHAASESEPNNTRGSATAIAVGEAVTGQMESTSDTDWYSFEITQQGYFYLDFEVDKYATESQINNGWDLEVYTSDGQNMIYQWTGFKDNFTSKKMPYEPGQYYIKIKNDWSLSGYAPVNVGYSITVHEQAATGWESEFNSTRKTANPIPTDTNTIYATVGKNDKDGDWFSFGVATRSIVTIDLRYDGRATSDERGNGLSVELFKENETTARSSATGRTEDYTVSVSVPAGQYYIHVSDGAYLSRPEQGTEYSVSYSATPTNIFDESEREGTKLNTTNTDGLMFYKDYQTGNVYCYYEDGTPVINSFACDGEYTYFFQADRTAMKNRLTYHPDGVHIIYFDGDGHEVFSNFANVKKTIAGESVNDYCFFDVYGYLYVDVVTYDKSGKKLYYANEYGVMDRSKWFRFSDTAKWADGTPFDRAGGDYGYATADCSLMTNRYTTDWNGNRCYMQGNGVAKY